MPYFRLSEKAETDLELIAQFTEEVWGPVQAQKYMRAMREACARITLQPKIGRQVQLQDWSGRRISQGSHILFYREDAEGIVVDRILHKSMLATRHEL